MFRKTFYTLMVGWMRACLRLGIVAIIILSAFPMGLAQADGVSETPSTAIQTSMDPVGAPPEAAGSMAWTHPVSMTDDVPMQVAPPPMSVRYPVRNKTSHLSAPIFELGLPEDARSVELGSGGTPQTSSSSMAGNSPSGIDPRSLPAGITIDLTYDVVMGFVDPAEAVTVTLGTQGYGAAVADGVGFFWTPIWHVTDGYKLDVDCGDYISIVVETDPAIEIVPPCMTGGIDVLNDEVYGTITGDTGGTLITATHGMSTMWGNTIQPPSPGAVNAMSTTLPDGSFEILFVGTDLGAESLAAVDVPYFGINLRAYFYPQEVFLVEQFNKIGGFAEPGQTITGTVYEGTTINERWTDSTTANWPHGDYTFWEVPIEVGDKVEVVLDESPPIQTIALELGNFDFDMTADNFTGVAPEGEDVRASLWQWSGEDRVYIEAHATATSGDTFTIDITPIDLRPRDEMLVVVSDTSGNQVQIASGPPFVSAYISLDSNLDCVLGRLDGPDLPIFVSLDKGAGEVYTRETGRTTDVGNEIYYCFVIRDSEDNYVDFSPGDTVTLDSDNPSNWSGSVEVADFSWSGDTTNDVINGTTSDGDLELTVHQWQDYWYPLHGTATMQVPVSSGGFSASFTNFDVRDGVTMDFSHYDSVTGYGTQTNGWSYWPTLPYFELQLPYGISGMVGSPGETVEAWLYDTDGTTLLGYTNEDGDDDPYRFWLGDFGEHSLEVGYKVVVSTSGGWTADMIVPELSIDGDIGSNLVTATGPTGLLYLEVQNADYSQGLSTFIPAASDVTWDLSHYDWDLLRGDRVIVTYQAPDGSRARVESQLTEVSAVNFWFNPGKKDWMQGVAKPGSWVTAERDSIILFTVYADPLCGGCWNIDEPIELNPGDVITVTAGEGLFPVVIQIPDPLTANADSSTDEVWGQIDHLDNEMVEIHGNWEEGYQEIYTDSSGNYSAIYTDIPQGADGHVRYVTMVNWSNIVFHQYFRTPDLALNVNYGHDWIEGWYPPGYEVTLTVKNFDQTETKATTTLMTDEIPWWGGGTGFSTNLEGTTWDPEQPDIQAEDWVIGDVTVGEDTYHSEVQLGTIDGDLDVDADRFTGTIAASWLDQDTPVPVQCHPWGAPEGVNGRETSVLPNGTDEFTCDWSGEWDIPPNNDIGVLYGDPGGHWIYNTFRGYTDELILNIHYDHDWIDGNYEPEHTVTLTVYDSEDRVKATISLPTGYIEGWGDTTGFATYQEGVEWVPQYPDIQPGDRIHGEVDDVSQYTADVLIGLVTGEPDLDGNSNSGTVDADWLMPDPVEVGCYIWEENGVNVYDSVVPSGTDNYDCVFEGDNYYDLVPGTNLMVAYFEPEGHQLIGDFSPPAPHLQIQKWFIGGGSPGEGGNAAFWVQYQNQGGLPAENVTITDTMVGMTYLRDDSGFVPSGGNTEKTWNLGTVEPGDWIGFVIVTEVTASEGDPISNTVEITTSDPYDMGDPSEKISTWEGTVAANDTYLSVDKWTWTWNPAPGEDFVYTINICNNGSTSSSEITVVDTLPGNTIFSGDWWGSDMGWEEISHTENSIELTHSCVSPRTCSEAYIRVTVDPTALPGDELHNHVEITAENDLSTGDDTADLYHNVGEPYMDLSINQNWNWGSLVPGGYYRYGINFRNEGNLPVGGPIEVTATLPHGTSFNGWDKWSWAFVGDPVESGNEITWTLEQGLDPGFDGTIEVWVTIDPDTIPGTELEHLAEIDIQPEESDIDNNTSTMTEMVQAHGPNLRIRKEGGVHGYGDGHNAWYRLRVENIGDETVDDVVVTDTYPPGMELDGEISTNYSEGWSWLDNDPEDQAFSVYLDRVEPDWNFDIDFNTVIPGEDPLEPGVIYENIAEVKPMAGDVNPDDNTASYTMATGPDMYVEKTWESGDFLPGEEITYLITFGNLHQDNDWWWDMAGNAILNDILPEGMSYVSAQQHWCGEEDDWCEVTPTIDGQTLTWELYPIGRSNWNEILLTVEIGDVEQTNPLINEVTIASDQPLVDVDPYPENNYSFYDPELVVTHSIYLPLIIR